MNVFEALPKRSWIINNQETHTFSFLLYWSSVGGWNIKHSCILQTLFHFILDFLVVIYGDRAAYGVKKPIKSKVHQQAHHYLFYNWTWRRTTGEAFEDQLGMTWKLWQDFPQCSYELTILPIIRARCYVFSGGCPLGRAEIGARTSAYFVINQLHLIFSFAFQPLCHIIYNWAFFIFIMGRC